MYSSASQQDVTLTEWNPETQKTAVDDVLSMEKFVCVQLRSTELMIQNYNWVGTHISILEKLMAASPYELPQDLYLAISTGRILV